MRSDWFNSLGCRKRPALFWKKKKKKAEGRSEKRGDADRRTGSQEPSTHYNQKQATKWNFFSWAESASLSWWEKKSLAMCNYPGNTEAMDNQILKAAGWWGLLSINQSLFNPDLSAEESDHVGRFCNAYSTVPFVGTAWKLSPRIHPLLLLRMDLQLTHNIIFLLLTRSHRSTKRGHLWPILGLSLLFTNWIHNGKCIAAFVQAFFHNINQYGYQISLNI